MPADALILDRSTVPPLAEIAESVRAGLPDERERLCEAATNEDFYQFRNARHLTKREGETDEDFLHRPKRYSRLTRVAIRKLSEPLYNPGPTREWEGDATLTAWLDTAYTAAHVNARMQSADRAATLNHVAAIQVEPTGDPRRPVKLWLWKAHEFVVHVRDNDPVTPWAVTTIERVPDPGGEPGMVRTRYRTWTAFERMTLVSDPWHGRRPSGEWSAPHLVAAESGDSPYPGALPFVFIRNEPPDSGFWEGGIGGPLRECNQDLDRCLSDLAEHVQAFLNPVAWARNVSVKSRYFDKIGEFVHLVADAAARTGDQKAQAELGYLQAQLGVEAAWYDLKTAADQCLEELEIPLTVVRSDASTDLSGVAIVAKTLPLVERTRQRQPQFSETEAELAAKVCAVVGAYHGEAALLRAALDPRLTCVWPEPKIPLPTPERDAADQWELEQGLADPIEILARRRGLTLSQAEQLAADIAKRRQTWVALMADVVQQEREMHSIPSEDETNGRATDDSDDSDSAEADPKDDPASKD